jgi:hypothetical protein
MSNENNTASDLGLDLGLDLGQAMSDMNMGDDTFDFTPPKDKEACKAMLREIFEEYELIETARTNAEAARAEAVAKQSECVRKMEMVYNVIAPGKKKISYKNQTLSIVCRPHTNGKTWFLRGKATKADSFEIL